MYWLYRDITGFSTAEMLVKQNVIITTSRVGRPYFPPTLQVLIHRRWWIPPALIRIWDNTEHYMHLAARENNPVDINR